LRGESSCVDSINIFTLYLSIKSIAVRCFDNFFPRIKCKKQKNKKKLKIVQNNQKFACKLVDAVCKLFAARHCCKTKQKNKR